MSAKTREEIQGFEYDWLATDSDGHVALFSTAGGGYAPDVFLRDIELFDAAIAAIVAEGANADALYAPPVEGDLQNTWKLMAERGVFAFDSDPEGGPYRLVAAPRKSVRLSELQDHISRVAGAIVLDLCFADVQELSTSTLQRAIKVAPGG
jgi:hypothetical protein